MYVASGKRKAMVRKRIEAKKEKPSVWINRDGYKETNEGLLHRVIYYHLNPGANKKWHVHHINCNRLDNEPQNLIALPGVLHIHIHKEIKRTNSVPGREAVLKYLEQWMEDQRKLSELDCASRNIERERLAIWQKYT